MWCKNRRFFFSCRNENPNFKKKTTNDNKWERKSYVCDTKSLRVFFRVLFLLLNPF